MTDEAMIAELRALLEKATPGPWGWRSFGGPPVLIGEHSTRPFVLDAARKGMQGATMRVRVNGIMEPFDALGLEPGDVFEDLFPGSGAVARAWERWCKAEHLMPGSAGGLLPFHVGAGDPGGAP